MRANVSIHEHTDLDPDLSWLGEYANREPTDGRPFIDREARGDCGRMEMRYFVGAYSGLSVHAFEQDYGRMENYNKGWWGMLGIVVTVSCGGVEGEASLWGIESDCGDEYRREVEEDLRRQAFNDWRIHVAAIQEIWCD